MARILVVEDDEKLNQIMCAYLARSGYQATGCHNPAEAYDLLCAGDYDLILSDIMMPGRMALILRGKSAARIRKFPFCS